MKVQENNITKFCSFYVSNLHLVTMLLPYINKKINKKVKIATILEKELESEVKILLEKLNLKNKEKILSLNWNRENKIEKLEKIENIKEIVIFINGSKEFIEKQNKKLEHILKEKAQNSKVKIVNCYEITEMKGNVRKILDKHDKILNTSGEKEITEIFVDYRKTQEEGIKIVN